MSLVALRFASMKSRVQRVYPDSPFETTTFPWDHKPLVESIVNINKAKSPGTLSIYSDTVDIDQVKPFLLM